MSGYVDPYRKQKKVATIVVSCVFVFSVVAAVSIGISIGGTHHTKEETTSENITAKKAIAAICEPTEDKEKCVQRLEFHAGNVTDPEELVRVVFRLTMKHVKRAANATGTLQEIEKDPRTNNTLQGCKELMNKSIRELKRTYKQWGELDIKKDKNVLADLKTWLSATITYQETCQDGFEEKAAGGSGGEKLREALETSLELSRSAIAMVSTIGDVLDELKVADNSPLGNDHTPANGHHGRLLQVGTGNRRLLEAIDLDNLKPNIVVAKDGSGRFTTINDALLRVPLHSDKPTVIHVKEGVYNEIVHIAPDMLHVFLIGDGADKTKITGSLNFVDGTPTWKTATFAVSGDYFMAKNIGFENSAGPKKHQAAALRVDADMAIFHKCTMDGYEDTLYVHAKRQFYRDCAISGTIDFVFGDASAVFQNCTFIVKKPMEKRNCMVTAQGRNYTYQPTAIVIQNSTITADPQFLSEKDQHKAYLGRPWRVYSRTIIMESYIDGFIDPEGWSPWEGERGTNTCFYSEFDNDGPGANKTQRVKWKGIKNISREEAQHFTAGEIIQGDEWIKRVAVPYNSGFFTNEKDQDSH